MPKVYVGIIVDTPKKVSVATWYPEGEIYTSVRTFWETAALLRVLKQLHQVWVYFKPVQKDKDIVSTLADVDVLNRKDLLTKLLAEKCANLDIPYKYRTSKPISAKEFKHLTGKTSPALEREAAMLVWGEGITRIESRKK